MYDLTNFTLRDMTQLGIMLRNIGLEAHSMEEVANRVVCYLYDHLGNPSTGEKSCALIRFYKTHIYTELTSDLQAFADKMLEDWPKRDHIKCLTLLATVGEKWEWNSRVYSVGHQAIPLPSEQILAQLPMIAQLVSQFGVEVRTILEPAPELILETEQHTFNVFCVTDASGSPYVPAQKEFVIPYGIRSVLGFGGLLPQGDLFAVIAFSKTPIKREVADMFKVIALNTKIAILPFIEKAVFNKATPVASPTLES